MEKGKHFLGNCGKKWGQGRKKAIAIPTLHNPHPTFGDLPIMMAGVCPILQQGEGKDTEAQPKPPKPARGPSQFSLGIVLSLPQDATT